MASFLKRAQTYLGLGPDEEYEEYDGDDGVAPVEHPAPVEAAPPPRPARPAAPARSRPAPPRPAAPAAASRPAPPGGAGSRPAAPAGAPPKAASPAGRQTLPPPPAQPAARPAAAAAGSSRPAPPKPPAKSKGRQTLPPPPAGGRSSAPPPPEPGEATSVRQLPSAGGGPAQPPRPKPVVRSTSASAKPVVVTPRTFNHAQEVADRFRSGQPVIMNLQGCDRALARRLIDFASGMCYGLDGSMEKVASQVYLVSPANVEVSAEERRRLAERGLHSV